MSGIELQGIDAMMREIRQRLTSGVDRIESRALRAGGELIAEDMRSRINVSGVNYVKSRHYRDDIRVSRVVRREGVKYVLIGPTKATSWRGHWLEWGTSRTPAQPHVEPAYHARKGQALMAIAEEFRRGLGR